MADGDQLVDDDGNDYLNDSGNELLSDGTADCPACAACGETCITCATNAVVSIIGAVVNSPGFGDSGHGNVVSGSGNFSGSFSLAVDGALAAAAGVSCAWSYYATYSAFSVEVSDVLVDGIPSGTSCHTDSLAVELYLVGGQYVLKVYLYKNDPSYTPPTPFRIFEAVFIPPDCPSGPTCNYYCFSKAGIPNEVIDSPSQAGSCDGSTGDNTNVFHDGTAGVTLSN